MGHPPVRYPYPQAVDQDVVIDPVEELLKVNIHDDPTARMTAPQGRRHAVGLHFTRRDRLVAGLPPAGVRPCRAHNNKGRPKSRPLDPDGSC